MKHSEGLYIVARTLSLDLFPERVDELNEFLTQDRTDWEKLVKISSDYLVLPAFYLAMKRHSLSHFLPDDLQVFLEDVIAANRDRNEMILEQVQELARIFQEEGIDILFLKGSAHLLKGLYPDPAERVLGDIDVAVRKNAMEKAAKILQESGYTPVVDFDPSIHARSIHYPRMEHSDKVAGIDVHRQLVLTEPAGMTIEGLMEESAIIEKNSGLRILSDAHLLIHNVFNAQVNDRAGYFGDIHLRQIYDLLLLSKFCSPGEALKMIGNYQRAAKRYFALAAHVFDAWSYFGIHPEPSLKLYLFRMKNISLKGGCVFKTYRWCAYVLFRVQRYFSIIGKALVSKQGREALRQRFRQSSWLRKHIRSYKRSRANIIE